MDTTLPNGRRRPSLPFLPLGRVSRLQAAAEHRALAEILAKPDDRLLEDAGLERAGAERLGRHDFFRLIRRLRNRRHGA